MLKSFALFHGASIGECRRGVSAHTIHTKTGNFQRFVGIVESFYRAKRLAYTTGPFNRYYIYIRARWGTCTRPMARERRERVRVVHYYSQRALILQLVKKNIYILWKIYSVWNECVIIERKKKKVMRKKFNIARAQTTAAVNRKYNFDFPRREGMSTH